PPTTTLFPYTTLFRSWRNGFMRCPSCPKFVPTFCLPPSAYRLQLKAGMRFLVTNDDGIESVFLHELVFALREGGHELYVVAPKRDRKSTRLNSSHVSI